jgi:hypothetical protein
MRQWGEILLNSVKKIKAIAICKNAKQIIESNNMLCGNVHSVFDNVCNVLTTDNDLIPLISCRVSNVPRSISLNLPIGESMYTLGLVKGMGVTFHIDKVCVATQFQIDLIGAKEWDPRPIFEFNRIEEMLLKRNVGNIGKILMHHGNFNGIANIGFLLNKQLPPFFSEERCSGLNTESRFILSRMKKLVDFIALDNLEGIRDASDEIVGFGPGLTPSADDFLSGLMVSLLYSSAYYGDDLARVYQINEAIIRRAAQRTTKVSEEMLKFAAEGQVAEGIRRLLLTIFSENKNSLEDSMLSVLDHGETSGSDLAAGIYIGCILGIWVIHNRIDKQKVQNQVQATNTQT